MGLGLPTSGSGDFIPYIKYNAKAGRWYSKYDEGDQEVTNMIAVMDLDNIKTGYLKFAAGQAPDYKFDTSAGAQDAPQPDDSYKRGFVVNLFSDANIGGLREFASCAGTVNEQMNAIYDAYLAAKDANPGKLPVVKCDGVEAIEGKHGTNYAPNLEIIQWADRPAEMTQSAGQPAPAAPVQQEVPPPAASGQPADGDVF